MKKILTAIGNENLNNELKKEKNIEILFHDIQYKEGIIEILENHNDLDFIILSILLPGEMSIRELIQKILETNKKIKIIIIFENKNEDLEKYLYNKGVYKIIYNNEMEIKDLINIINYNSENEDLKEEIDKLKNIILEKNKKENKNRIKKIKKLIINKIKNNKIKLIFSKIKNKTITNKNNKKHKNKKTNNKLIFNKNNLESGKSIISIKFSKSNIYSINKILLIEINSENNIENKLKNNSENNSKNNLEKNFSQQILNLKNTSKIKQIKIIL